MMISKIENTLPTDREIPKDSNEMNEIKEVAIRTRKVKCLKGGVDSCYTYTVK